ncbi:MAG: hypothetical protein M3Y87_10795, partial [Myxococcota bacterium]|nr:hypothetical protein [Myxococcota bacterium]
MAIDPLRFARMRKRSDPTAVVEAAYDLHQPEPAWLEGLLRAAQPLLDEGQGLQAFVADVNAPPRQLARSAAAVGGAGNWPDRWRAEWWESVVLALPDDLLIAGVTFGPVWYASIGADALSQKHPTLELYLREIADRGHEWARAVARRERTTRARDTGLPFQETFNVQATDPTGHAVVLAANRLDLAARPPNRAVLRAWTRVASHITAAFRARRKLGARDP